MGELVYIKLNGGKKPIPVDHDTAMYLIKRGKAVLTPQRYSTATASRYQRAVSKRPKKEGDN